MYCLTSDGTDEGYPVPTKFFILNEKVQSLNYGTLMAQKRNDTSDWKKSVLTVLDQYDKDDGYQPGNPAMPVSPTLEPKRTPGAAK